MKIKSIVLTITLMLAITSAWSQDQIQSPQESPAQDVSDQELNNFADAYMEIQSENQKMQQEAVKTIEDEGMDVQRFNEIAQSQNNAEVKTEVSKEENKQVEQIKVKLQEMQAKFQQEVAGMIEKKGLTVQRYQEINQAVRQDEELQGKLQKIIQG